MHKVQNVSAATGCNELGSETEDLSIVEVPAIVGEVYYKGDELVVFYCPIQKRRFHLCAPFHCIIADLSATKGEKTPSSATIVTLVAAPFLSSTIGSFIRPIADYLIFDFPDTIASFWKRVGNFTSLVGLLAAASALTFTPMYFLFNNHQRIVPKEPSTAQEISIVRPKLRSTTSAKFSSNSKPIPSDQEPTTITMTEDGLIYLNAYSISTLDDLTKRLRAMVRTEKLSAVFFRGDQTLPIAEIDAALSAISKAGISDIGMVVRKP